MTSSIDIFKKHIKSQLLSHIPPIKYKTNFTNCIQEVLENRGYQKTQDDDWAIVWSEKDGLNQIYQKRLQPHQKVNHFRNYYELCKKDFLIKNLKKHKKALQKDGKMAQAKQYNFFPLTYVLPSQYVLFADEFKKNSNNNSNSKADNLWIMKPIGKSQGKGIFLVNKLNQLSSWEFSSNINANNTPVQPYVIQKYINDPLLIGGKKFDLRIYVLVVSYNPLTVYLYRNGFARFTHTRYDESKIHQTQIHLTNVAIQKNCSNYDQSIGGKWYLDKLKTYLNSRYTSQAVNQSFLKIQTICTKTLQAMCKIMTHDRQNSFQLYGFDIMLDKNLTPWLIQVNGSPSMTANTKNDKVMKLDILDDALTIIDMEKFLTGNQNQIGGFDLICKKGKNNQKNLVEKSKVSFLGDLINRDQVYKKIAKINSTRINTQLQNTVPPTISKNSYTNATNNSQQNKNASYRQNAQKSIVDRRKIMSQSNNQHPITPSNLNSQNMSRLNPPLPTKRPANLVNSRRNIPLNIAKNSSNKDFVIKQKLSSVQNSIVAKRQITNENEEQSQR